MTTPIAFHSGQIVPADQLVVAPQDMGFMLGVTVAEQLRTFQGKLFQVDEHFARLRQSLKIMGVEGVDLNEVLAATEQVTSHNFRLVEADSDLGVTVFVTPGLYPTYSPNGEVEPRIGVHTYTLPFAQWAAKYDSGQRCVVTQIRQVPKACWPSELKCRSRAHYFLADQEARSHDPQARAILLDVDGNLNEASTANVIAYFAGEGLVSPPLDRILPGISLNFLQSIARNEGYQFTFRKIAAEELNHADELLLTSTPFCLLPVSRLNDRDLENRECFRRLIKAWSSQVGVDIQSQARRLA